MQVESVHQSYFNEIMKPEYDPVNDEQIKEWLAIAQEGYDEETDTWLTEKAIEAKDNILRVNMRLSPYVVHKVTKGNHPLFMDCISECFFVMEKCIVGFDLEDDTHFATYAQIALFRRIWRFLRENSGAVTLPSGQLKKRKKVEDEIYANPDALDKLFKGDFEPVNLVCSLDYNFDDGQKVHKSPFKDIPFEHNPSNIMSNVEMRKMAVNSLECLTDKEMLIIESRLLIDEKVTLRDLATQIGATGERVRQIEVFALKKMRKHIAQNEKHKESF